VLIDGLKCHVNENGGSVNLVKSRIVLIGANSGSFFLRRKEFLFIQPLLLHKDHINRCYGAERLK
jgi:hypothetical protein